MAAHHAHAAALLPPPAVADEHLGSILPACDAPDPTERSSQALNRARAVELAANMQGGAATREEVIRNRHFLAVMEAHTAVGTPYASPTNQQLAAQMQQMQQQHVKLVWQLKCLVLQAERQPAHVPAFDSIVSVDFHQIINISNKSCSDPGSDCGA
jgi:hypothetical protein